LADGVGAVFLGSGLTVPADGSWHFVAMVADRSAAGGLTFYVDGATSSTAPVTTVSKSLATAVPFTVGAPSTPGYWPFTGDIDEVEFFRRLLSPAEAAAIYAAGPQGKCKLSCWVPFRRVVSSPLALGYFVESTICNASAAPKLVNWSLTQTFGVGCQSAAVGLSPSSGTVFVPGGSCVTVTSLMVPIPAGGGDAVCLSFNAVEPATGASTTCQGSVALAGFFAAGPGLTLDENQPGVVTIDFGDAGGGGGTFGYQVEVVDSETGVPVGGVLDGPGLGFPLTGSVTLPPGGVATVGIPVVGRTGDPLRCYTLAVRPNVGAFTSTDLVGSIPFSVRPDHRPGRAFFVASPAGPGSLEIAHVGGTPGALYFTAVTLNAGVFPCGWFGGLDISLFDLLNQLSVGVPPFFGTLDGDGNSSFSLPPGVLPSGLTLYFTSLEAPPPAAEPAFFGAGIAHTIP
jgi:hypothetical protein